ncbi:MAG: NAD(P)H-binding protein [Sandaracinaceae bacterium]
MTKTLFIAGATGLTGRAAVDHAAGLGLRVHAHVRPDSSRRDAWIARFEAAGAVPDTTAWEEGAMTETLARVQPDAVLALLGTTRKRARQAKQRGADPAAESYEAVDYGLTALLRRAAEASGVSPRFVYLSAVGVNPGAKNPYMAVRARVEAELREGALPWVVARPSFILGDRDEARAGESVGAGLADGALRLLGALGATTTRDRYSSMTGEQLARAMVSLAVNDGVEGEVFETERLRRL